MLLQASIAPFSPPLLPSRPHQRNKAHSRINPAAEEARAALP
nr:MAG TPA: hypothetical protein [Caudoviricetes sp.]